MTNTGTFTLTGGIIYNNTAEWVYDWIIGDGGGVYNSGAFTMEGGTINKNKAGVYGGGVYNVNFPLFIWPPPDYFFTMRGGTISDNEAGTDGGGVCNHYTSFSPYSVFTMEGGNILNNTAKNNGGGVFSQGAFNMSNGEISGNRAANGGGVFWCDHIPVVPVLLGIQNSAAPLCSCSSSWWGSNTYRGLIISDTSVIRNNMAGTMTVYNYTGIDDPPDVPVLPNVDNNVRWSGTNTFGGTINSAGVVTGIHLLNNWDVNYDKNPLASGAYRITYDGNGHTAGTPPVDPTNYPEGADATILSPGDMTKTGYTFVRWETGPGVVPAESYNPGNVRVMTSDITLFAQWKLNETYRITYNGNGHTAGAPPVDPTNYLEGTSATILGPGNMTKTNHTFVRWETGPGVTPAESYNPGNVRVMTSDITLFAQWKLNETTPSGGGGGSRNNNTADVERPDEGYEEEQKPDPEPEKGMTAVILFFMVAIAVFCYRRFEETENEK
ncbi:MAG: InlB B-repeat-containing protein [Methanosarcinales archaeon]|nr:InlB B-repeat-containing protein [Methanosarcinales archaeon]